MGLLQDFSINGLEESGHHSPLRESMFIKGEGVLKKSHWEKKGEGGTWPQKGRGKDRYYIMELLNDPLLIEDKKVSTLAL